MALPCMPLDDNAVRGRAPFLPARQDESRPPALRIGSPYSRVLGLTPSHSALGGNRMEEGRSGVIVVTLRETPPDRRVLALLNGEVLWEVFRHAHTAYPEECCGMILDAGVRPCRNAQDDLHRADPIAFPRTAIEGFCFDAGDQLFLLESLETMEPVRVVYHSHPGGTADLSAADRAGLLWEEGPVFPTLFHLVVDCRPDHGSEARLHQYSFGVGEFRETARFREADGRLAGQGRLAGKGGRHRGGPGVTGPAGAGRSPAHTSRAKCVLYYT